MSTQQIQPPPRYKHWELFLILENEFQTISRYVEIHPDNDDTYSLEIASLLVRCCGIQVILAILGNRQYRGVFAAPYR